MLIFADTSAYLWLIRATANATQKNGKEPAPWKCNNTIIAPSIPKVHTFPYPEQMCHEGSITDSISSQPGSLNYHSLSNL
jgi:hypothetical protein